MRWMEDYEALLAPSLRCRVDPDGVFRAEGSTALVGVLLITPMILLLAWAFSVGGRGAWIMALLFCLGVIPFALSALVQKVALTIDRSQIRYEKRGLRTRSSVVPRSALHCVSLTKLVYQAESRFVVYHAELRFENERIPACVKVFESLDLSKARNVAEMLSSTLSCPLKEENLERE